MCQLLESIKIKDNKAVALKYHLSRMRNASLELWETTEPAPNMKEIQESLDALDPDTVYKLRLLYSRDNYEFEIQAYNARKIESLKIVHHDNLDYHLKWADRDALDHLFAQREEHDDILIVKNGMVTDSYYCNVAFKKNDLWYTPAEPLLKGTKRKQLLDAGLILEMPIDIESIQQFEAICLFNAMLDWQSITLNTDQIF